MKLMNLILFVPLFLAVCPFVRGEDSIANSYVESVQDSHKLWYENYVLRERLRQLGELTDDQPIEKAFPAGAAFEGFVTILIDGAVKRQHATGKIVKSDLMSASLDLSLEDGTVVRYDYQSDGRDHFLLKYFAITETPLTGQQTVLPSRGQFVGNGIFNANGDSMTISTDYITYGKTHWARFELKKK